MKTLDLNQMESLNGGGWFSDACDGFGATTVALEALAYFNLWNPVGQAALGTMLTISIACQFL